MERIKGFAADLSVYEEALGYAINSFMDNNDLIALVESIKTSAGDINPTFGALFVTDVLSGLKDGEGLLNKVTGQAKDLGISPWENTSGSSRLLALSCLWEMVGNNEKAGQG